MSDANRLPLKVFLASLLTVLFAFAAPGPMVTEAPAACDPDNAWDDRFRTSGVNGPIYDVAAGASGEVYIVGAFTAVDDVAANHVAKWDGTRWSALGAGVSGGYAVAVSGTDVYVGGDNVSKWDGSTWTSLGSAGAGSVQS